MSPTPSVLASELMRAKSAGRLTQATISSGSIFDNEIGPIADGTVQPQCNIDTRVLQTLVVVIRSYSSVQLTDLNRWCANDGTHTCTGADASPWHCAKPAIAIDFGAINGLKLDGSNAATIDLLGTLNSFLPSRMHVGQNNCRPGRPLPSYYGLSNLGNEFNDKCNHQHIDFSSATGEMRVTFQAPPPAGVVGPNGLRWTSTDIPITGDWNGDHKTDIGVVQNYVFNESIGGALYGTVSFGNGLLNGDVPVTGDWNGDGKADVGIYRGNTFIESVGGAVYATIMFGNGIAHGDIPITGDWNGDGKTDVGVVQNFVFNESIDGSRYATVTFGNGIANGDIPITGDWNGDGKTDVGINRGNTFIESVGGSVYASIVFGNGIAGGDIPITGDWDGDDKTDVGIVRSNQFIESVGGAVYASPSFGNGSKATL